MAPIIFISVQIFNHMGNYVEGGILSTETLAKSNEKVTCFIDQYSEYEIPGSGGKKVILYFIILSTILFKKLYQSERDDV